MTCSLYQTGYRVYKRSTGKFIASTGSSRDGHLCIWDWRGSAMLSRQPVHASCCLAVCFTEDGSSVITTGKEHFKASEPRRTTDTYC